MVNLDLAREEAALAQVADGPASGVDGPTKTTGRTVPRPRSTSGDVGSGAGAGACLLVGLAS